MKFVHLRERLKPLPVVHVWSKLPIEIKEEIGLIYIFSIWPGAGTTVATNESCDTLMDKALRSRIVEDA
jgi:hypothetical protein